MNFPHNVPTPKNNGRCVFEGCWKGSFFESFVAPGKNSCCKLRPRLSSEVIKSPGAERLSSSFSGFALGVLLLCTFSVLFLWISKLGLCASKFEATRSCPNYQFFFVIDYSVSQPAIVILLFSYYSYLPLRGVWRTQHSPLGWLQRSRTTHFTGFLKLSGKNSKLINKCNDY